MHSPLVNVCASGPSLDSILGFFQNYSKEFWCREIHQQQNCLDLWIEDVDRTQLEWGQAFTITITFEYLQLILVNSSFLQLLGTHLAHRSQRGQGGVQEASVRPIPVPGGRGHHLRHEQEEASRRGGWGTLGDRELPLTGVRREGGFMSRPMP